MEPTNTEAREAPIDKQIEKSNPAKAPDTKSESGKDTELNLENARAFGIFYNSFIKSLTGEGEMKDVNSFGLDEKNQQLARSMLVAVDTERGIQHSRMEMKGWGAKELLEQIRSDEKAKELLADTSRYRIQEFSKGIYGVFVGPDLYDEFAPRGSQATAVKPLTEEGISFVIIREFKDKQNKEANKKQMEENIPHEIHHIAWSFLQKQGIITAEEQHPEKQKAFSMYQDELVAKLVSEGSILGYTHLQRIEKEQRERIEKEQPEITSEINQVSNDMYDYLHDILEPAIKNSEVLKQDCLLAVATSTTFSELISNLNRMEEIVREQPKIQETPEQQKSPEEISGWGSI